MANFIHPTAIIGDNVIIGDGNYIGAYCIIGDKAEHKKFGTEWDAKIKKWYWVGLIDKIPDELMDKLIK